MTSGLADVAALVVGGVMILDCVGIAEIGTAITGDVLICDPLRLGRAEEPGRDCATGLRSAGSADVVVGVWDSATVSGCIPGRRCCSCCTMIAGGCGA